jgi:hypothetical protein
MRLFFGTVALVSAFSCSDDKEGYKYNAPAMAPIVDSATPSGLKGAASLLGAEEFLALVDSADSEDAFKTYISSYVFKKDTTGKVAGPVYYRYWVDVVDEAMAQIKKRIAEVEDSSDRCWNKDSVSIDHSITIGSEKVTVKGKYHCWENQSTPTAAAGGLQKMAFGRDDNNYYLMYVTSDATDFAASQGERIVIATVAADESTADIWFIGRSRQVGPAGDKIQGVANRIIANKTSGAFTFALSDEGIGSVNCAMFARSNGSVVNFQARTPLPGSSSECKDVQNMAWGSGACYDSKTLAATTGCDGLEKAPSNFGPASPFKETDVVSVKSDSERLTKIDFAAAGVTELVKK